MDLSKTIIPKSDQLNADDLIAGARTIKIRDIKLKEDEAQSVSIYFYGDDNKPFKPCKSVRRMLVQLWGANGLDWIGRRLTLYRDDTVKWAGVEAGGIRVSHASHITTATRVLMTTSKNNRRPVDVIALPPVEIKDFEAAKKALKEKRTTIEKIISMHDVTPEQLKILKDETV
jgi:hypothetical protein